MPLSDGLRMSQEERERLAEPQTQPIADDRLLEAPGEQLQAKAELQTRGPEQISLRRSSIRLGHTHLGFRHIRKSPAPEPQSIQVQVLGELFAPHPINCKHLGPNDKPDQSSGQDLQKNDEEPFQPTTHEPETSEQKAEGRASAQESSSPSATETSQVCIVDENLTNPPTSIPIHENPSIQVLPPPDSHSSLGTKAIRTTAANQPDKMNIFKAGSSKTAVPSPGVVENSLATKPISPGGIRSLDLPVGSLPLDLTSLPQLDISAVPVAGGLGNESNPPHARKRMRSKLKHTVKPQLAKARKLILKKKILSLILGKELTAVLQPHLNAATPGASGSADNGPAAPIPTPL